jgi:hypothetical protein
MDKLPIVPILWLLSWCLGLLLGTALTITFLFVDLYWQEKTPEPMGCVVIDYGPGGAWAGLRVTS